MNYFIIIISISLISLYIYIFILKFKIKKLEIKIRKSLNTRTNLIPIIFEVTKWLLNKHDEIFKEVIKLRKMEFVSINMEDDLENILNIESLIHHELNFIFKICDKNKDLEKNEKFLYVKELLSDKNLEISENIEIHKKASIIYNNFINIKNITWFWILIPLYKIWS